MINQNRFSAIEFCFVNLSSWLVGLLLLGAGGSTRCAMAQQAASQSAAKPAAQIRVPRPNAQQAYRLGPQDVLSIVVAGQPPLSNDQVVVSSSGKITLPVVGTLSVSGKTIEQVTQELIKALRGELVRPQVNVILKQPRPQLISILGPIAKPGAFDLKPGWRITDALAASGGVIGRVDLVDAVLTRLDGRVFPLDIPQILEHSNGADNLMLQAGDILRFTSRSIPISIAGQVKSAGNYDAPLDSSIAEAIALAGGPLPGAALSKTTVKRSDGKVLSVDLKEALAKLDSPSNIKLQARDFIMIPQATERVMVIGAVQKPGFLDIEDGGRLYIAEAVALSGGAAPKAALTKAMVKHADGTLVPVNLHRVMMLGDLTENIKLAAGDTVTIPESQDRVAVLGAVQRPGSFDLADAVPLHVAEVVTLANGVTPKAALTRATVTHRDGSLTPVDLFKVLIRNEQADNLLVVDGDVITIPESKGVAILGAVAKPGPYSIEEGANPRMTDMLALAGGLSIKTDTARITISRRSAEGQPTTVEIDPVGLMEQRDLAQNAQIRDGDLITISSIKTPTVFLSGEVKVPGAYEVKPGDGMPELLTRAGGITEAAALNKVLVQRGDKTLTVDVHSALEHGQPLDFPLQEGDFVVVPKNLVRVLVMPAVNKPGYYSIPENGTLTVGEALSLAGGAKDRAKLKEVAILRQTSTGVERQVLPLDKVQEGQILPLNHVLQGGDILYVPEGKQSGSFWSKLTGSVGILSLLIP